MGYQFYKKKGLKSVTIHVPPAVLKELKQMALDKETTLSKAVKALVESGLAHYRGLQPQGQHGGKGPNGEKKGIGRAF